MEFAHFYILALAVLATALLALEKAHLSVIGIGLIVAVALPGVVDVRLAIAGFANTAVVTVAALYIVGEAFLRTGAASVLADRILHRTRGQESTVVFLIMVMAAALSAFVNNILVVVTFLPVVTSICRDTGITPSRLLMPLSYASILGGMCTLVGTSTNLLVSGKLEDAGMAPISMFELSGLGLLLAGIGLLYMGLIGRHLLPRVPSLAAQVSATTVQEYVTEITISDGSPSIGKPIAAVLPSKARARVAMLVRNEVVLRPPFENDVARAGDILVVSGNVRELAELHAARKERDPSDTDRYDPSSMSFFELALTPSSNMIGRKVRNVELKRRHDAVVCGLMRNGAHLQQRIGDIRLRTGDVLLAFGNDRARESLRHSSDYHLIEGVDETIYRREKAPTAVAILLVVVAAFAFLSTWVHPCTVALGGALAMVLTGCLTVRQAHRAVNWPIIMFIAGTIALSNALTESGTDDLVGGFLADQLTVFGPHVLLGGVFLVTIVLTELLSNNAVAVMMTPVAIAAGHAAGIEDPRPLVMAVAFGASTWYANPAAYKTNLMVYGPGGYRFRDFFRTGLLLDALLGFSGVMLLPLFFPL